MCSSKTKFSLGRERGIARPELGGGAVQNEARGDDPRGCVFPMQTKHGTTGSHTPPLVYPFFHRWALGLFPPCVWFE